MNLRSIGAVAALDGYGLALEVDVFVVRARRDEYEVAVHGGIDRALDRRVVGRDVKCPSDQRGRSRANGKAGGEQGPDGAQHRKSPSSTSTTQRTALRECVGSASSV